MTVRGLALAALRTFQIRWALVSAGLRNGPYGSRCCSSRSKVPRSKVGRLFFTDPLTEKDMQPGHGLFHSNFRINDHSTDVSGITAIFAAVSAR